MKILSITCLILCVATIAYMVFIYWESRSYKLSRGDDDEHPF